MTWLAARSLPFRDALPRYLTVLLTEMVVGGPVTVALPALAALRSALPDRAGATLRRRWLPAPQTLALLRLASSYLLCARWPSRRRC